MTVRQAGDEAGAEMQINTLLPVDTSLLYQFLSNKPAKSVKQSGTEE